MEVFEGEQMTVWNGEEKRKSGIKSEINSDILENCVYKAWAKIKKEEKEEEREAFRLHQAECPAFQGQKLVKWLVGLPVISTIAIVVFHYFFKNHGIK